MVVNLRNLLAAAAVLVIGSSGCRIVAGLEDRTLVAPNQDAGIEDAESEWYTPSDAASEATEGGDDGASDAQGTECFLPAPGAVSLRLGNLMPDTQRVDFCVKPSEQSSFDGVLPLISSGGPACPRGLSYRDVTRSFGSDAGVYDIAVVPFDETTILEQACTGDPLSLVSSVELAEGDTMSVVVLGDAASGITVEVMPEAAPPTEATKVRFVHGLVGATNLDCGRCTAEDLPAEVTDVAFTDVPFGYSTQPGSTALGTVDEAGYLTLQPESSFIFGVSRAGQAEAVMAKAAPLSVGRAYTAFALGKLDDVRFPAELYLCDEQEADGIYAVCGGGTVDLRVDSFNAYLRGPFGPYDAERALQLSQTINELDTDVVCVQEVWSKQHRAAILAETSQRFPFSAAFANDLDTENDDPKDASGMVPPSFEVPPCGEDDTALLDGAIECLRDNCLEPVGEEDAVATPDVGTCMTDTCLLALAPLLSGTVKQKECFACLYNGLASYGTAASVRSACTTDPRARYGYAGGSGTMVLSRFPIEDAEQWVLPSTDRRINVIRAPVRLTNQAVVDIYCTQLTEPADNPLRPYTGHYGDNQDKLTAWQQELYLQTDKLAGWVVETSTRRGRRAVLSGTIYAGPALEYGGFPFLEGINEPAYNLLSTRFPPAVTADFMARCTHCSYNGLVASASDTWQSHNFLSGIPITAVQVAQVVEYSQIVDLPDAAFPVPVTPHFGFRSTVRMVR